MSDITLKQFVRDLAERTPTPGGGAAAAQAASMATALLTMVVRFTRGKGHPEADERVLEEVENLLVDVTDRIMPMAERDMASFERVALAYKLPKGTDEQQLVRSRAIQEGLLGAIVVPEELIHHVRDILAAVTRVSDSVGRNIAADLGTGVSLLYAAARSAQLMVHTNTSFFADRDHARTVNDRCDEVVREIIVYRDDLQARAEALAR